MFKKILIVFVLCFFSFLVQTNAMAPICIYEKDGSGNDVGGLIYYDGTTLKMDLLGFGVNDMVVFLLSGYPISNATRVLDSTGYDDTIDNDNYDVIYNSSNTSEIFNENKICPKYIYTDYIGDGPMNIGGGILGVAEDFVENLTGADTEEYYGILFSDDRNAPTGTIDIYELQSGLANDLLQERDLDVLLSNDQQYIEQMAQKAPSTDAYINELITKFDTYKQWISAATNNSEKIMLYRIVGQNNDYSNFATRIVNTINPSNGTCGLLNDNQCSNLYESATDFLEEYNINGLNGITQDVNSCEDVIGDPNVKGSFAYYLVEILDLIKFLAPVLVIVLTISDYVKAICASDNDVMKKNNKRLIKRLIYMVVLFIIPIVIKFILDKIIFEAHGCGIL